MYSLVGSRKTAACRTGTSSSAQVYRYGVPLACSGGSRREEGLASESAIESAVVLPTKIAAHGFTWNGL